MNLGITVCIATYNGSSKILDTINAILNNSIEEIQLTRRHWFITDGEGEVQEVKGLGVVGQQPLLRSGEHFEYTSWATLPTPAGTMRGEYFCVTEDAQFFQANIPEFALVMPRTLH